MRSRAARKRVIAFIFLYNPNPIGINNVGASVLLLLDLLPHLVTHTGWKYYISYCIFLLFDVAFIWFLFNETSNRSIEELRVKPSVCTSLPPYMLCPMLIRDADSVVCTVFEGDQVRAEQQKRIEEEVLDNKAPIPDGASDKKSLIHVEHKRD